jgi:hypothetical protein
MKLLPTLFERSQVNRQPPRINAYDVVHACCLLQNFNHSLKKNDFATSKPQVGRTPIKPKAGPFGEGNQEKAKKSNTSEKSQVSDDRRKEIRRRYIGPFTEAQRDSIVRILMDPETGYATDEAVNRLVQRIGKASLREEDTESPTVLDMDEVRVLVDEVTGDYFEQNCLIHEPDEMTTLPTASVKEDLNITEILATGEKIAKAFEVDTEVDTEADPEADPDEESNEEDGETYSGESGWEAEVWSDKATTQKLEQVSAPSAPLVEACNYAGIPIIDGQPTLNLRDKDGSARTTALQPWQPSAITWLLHQLENPLRGGILADGCGLGKTLTSLCLVHYSIERSVKKNPQADFGATLIVVPAKVILQWVSQIEQYFGGLFKIWIFWGTSEHISNPRRKGRTISSTDELLEKLENLDEKDPQTAYNIVVTTYDTMRQRTIKEVHS